MNHPQRLIWKPKAHLYNNIDYLFIFIIYMYMAYNLI